MMALRNKVHQILRQTEGLFKTDMVYVAKGGFWTTLGFITSMAVSIVSAFIYGNFLPREVYGTYNYLLSLGAALSFLTLSGIGPVVVRAVARGLDNIIPYALKLQLKANILAVATICGGAIYYLWHGNWTFGFALLLLILAYPISGAFHIYEQALTGRKRFDQVTMVGIISNLVSVTTTILIVVVLKIQDILVLIAGYALSSLLVNMIAYFWTRRRTTSVAQPDNETVKEVRNNAFHLTGAGIIGSLATYIDKIVLFQIAGPASLAVYGFAIAGPERLKGLLKKWVGIALPRLAERSLSEIRSLFYTRLIISILIGIVFAIIYILLAPLLFHILLPKYLDSIHYSQVYAISLIMVPVLSYVGNIFYSQNMIRAIYLTSNSVQVLRILLFIILGWQWQVWGLIVASILSNILGVLYDIWIWEKEYKRLTT